MTACTWWTTWLGGRSDRVPPGRSSTQLDVREAGAIRSLFAQVRPDAVFHLAAQIDVRVSVDEPGLDADVNVAARSNVLEAARRSVRGCVFSSTGGAIYGEADRSPRPRRRRARRWRPTASRKLCGENYLALSNRLYGTRHVALRYGNVYGPRQDPHGEAGVVAIFFGRAGRRSSRSVFGDGKQTRDYVYVGDVVAANLAASAYDGSVEVFNVGTGSETSVVDLLERCQRAAGTAVTPEHRPARLGELDRSCLDCGLAQRELGWAAAMAMDEGLRGTLAALHP